MKDLWSRRGWKATTMKIILSFVLFIGISTVGPEIVEPIARALFSLTVGDVPDWRDGIDTGFSREVEIDPSRLRLPNYTVVDEQDISVGSLRRNSVRVVLDTYSIEHESIMYRVAEKIWKQEPKIWDKFVVFMYLPFMETEGGAYAVAEFNQTGRLDFRVYQATLESYEIERYGSTQ
jgi:hypothetical protein